MRSAALFLALLFPLPLAAQTPLNTAAPEPAPVAPLKVGGDVLPPTLEHQADLKYPRPFFGRPKSGHVLVGLIVDANGLPTRLHILRSGGAPFDKSALAAVAQYRFHPATRLGTPVPVEVNIDVDFQIR